MINFWIEVLWTLLITIAMVLIDLGVGLFIAYVRSHTAIERAIEQATTDDKKVEDVRKQIEKLRTRRAAALTWGADLAAVALSLDLAVLLLWISDPVMFPFFSRWNTASVSKELPVWIILLLAHGVLWLMSIFFKHLHGERIEATEPSQIASLFRRGWVHQNVWMLTGNSIGSLALLLSFVVATNAI